MASDVEKVEEAQREAKEAVDSGVDGIRPLKGGDSSSVKLKIKKDCDSRKRLEERLEQARVDRQVQEYDFGDFD